MSVEIKVPVLPESVADATVSEWHKKEGDTVARGDVIVELETDKVMMEVPAPQDGVLEKIIAQPGETVTSSDVLAVVAGAGSATVNSGARAEVASANDDAAEDSVGDIAAGLEDKDEHKLSPAVRRLVQEHEIDASKIVGSGRDGRITKQDVLHYIKNHTPISEAAPVEKNDLDSVVAEPIAGDRTEKRVRMTRLRARIAERLLESQKTAAMLTTFNEVNMQAVMNLRKKYKDDFEKTHGVRLGLASFFVKAAVEALKQFPVVNASIDGGDIVYHNFMDISVAVGGGPRGLVVPVLRNTEQMNLAEIEKGIRSYAAKAREGKITIQDMEGGTFTITNGGVYGSMLSTPIINPPQCAILGMHSITDRAVVENGQVVVRPMMYLALSYDHRLIDGEEAVRFLVAIKDALEDPARMLLAL